MRVKIRWLASALAAYLFLALPAGAITVKEILAKHAEAKGGMKAWQALNTLQLSGSFTAFSDSGPFTLSRQRPNLYLFEYQAPQGRTVRGYDGQTVWAADPFAGVGWALELGHADAQAMVPEADFAGALLDASLLGHEIELVSQGDFDGEDTFGLEVHRKDGYTETWYLSSKTFLEFARVAPAADFGTLIEEGRTYYLDFRSVDGLMIPHHVEREYGARLRIFEIETVTLNPNLGEGFSEIELPGAMADLASLAGDWNVKVETRSHPRSPWLETTTSSTIEAKFHGALLEETLRYDLGGRVQETFHLRSYDRSMEVVSETFFDNSTLHRNVLQGQLADGQLAVTNLETATALGSGEDLTHDRHTTYEILPDSFKIRGETSTNGGKKWTENLRLTYTRKP